MGLLLAVNNEVGMTDYALLKRPLVLRVCSLGLFICLKLSALHCLKLSNWLAKLSFFPSSTLFVRSRLGVRFV